MVPPSEDTGLLEDAPDTSRPEEPTTRSDSRTLVRDLSAREDTGLLEEKRRKSLQEKPAPRQRPTMTRAEFKSIVADYKTCLPAWAYEPDVAKLADDFEESPTIPAPMGCAVAPAVVWAKRGLWLLWPPMLGFFYLAYMTSRCGEKGYSEYPQWIWGVFSPFAVLHLWVEWKCLRYSIIPFVQVCGPLKSFGKELGFAPWAAGALFQSILNILDNGTDSLFLATTVDSERCHGSALNDVWSEVLRQSPILFWLKDVPVSWFILAAYALSFMQLLFPLLESTPTCGDKPVDYKVGTKDETGKPYNLGFTNLLGEKMNLGDTLYILGEANLMASLQLQNPAYPRGKFNLIYEETQFRHQPQQTERLLSFARNALSRGLVRIGLVALMENSVQINLQVSLMSITRATMPFNEDGTKDFQGQMAFSIGLSLCMLLIKLKEAWELWLFKKHVMAMIPPGADCTAQEKKAYASVTFYGRCVIVMAVLLLMNLAWAAAKYVACFECRDSLWNLGTGCVDLGHVLRKTEK